MSQPTFENLGPMRMTHPNLDPEVGVVVEGIPEAIASKIDWGPIIDMGKEIVDKIFGDGGGKKPKGCVKTVTTLPDGSTISTEFCPPP